MTEQQLLARIKEMTLEEKIAQLLQLAGPFLKGRTGRLPVPWLPWALPAR